MYRRFVSRVLLLAIKQTLAFGDCTTANQLIFVTNRVTNCSEALKHTTNYFIGKIRVVQPYVGANVWLVYLTSIEVSSPFLSLTILCVF